MSKILTRFAAVALLALVPQLGLPAALAGTMLQAGAQFPSWNLVDHTGQRLSSAELAGKSYLLWFYPKAMTPGCTAEGRAFRDSFAAFTTAGVEILGVSFDTPAGNRRFVEQERFPFRLLSDSERQLALAVGAADTPDQGYARRISYLIGPTGTVRAAYGTVVPTAHASEVLADCGK